MNIITVINCSAFSGGVAAQLTDQYIKIINKTENVYSKVSLMDFVKRIDINNIRNRTEEFQTLFESEFKETNKIIFIVPEYNAGFPGILKLFLEVSDHTKWKGKKACIVGLSGGRGGNLRGMEHLASILNYLKINVHYNKLPLSNSKDLFDLGGNLYSGTLQIIEEQITEFLEF